MDWERALEVFILGFGGVFVSLLILTVFIRLCGYVIQKLVNPNRKS